MQVWPIVSGTDEHDCGPGPSAGVGDGWGVPPAALVPPEDVQRAHALPEQAHSVHMLCRHTHVPGFYFGFGEHLTYTHFKKFVCLYFQIQFIWEYAIRRQFIGSI